MGNWFSYEWYVKGRPVSIHVGLTWEGRRQAAALPVLARVEVDAGARQGLFGGRGQERRMQKLADRLGLAYVGRVEREDGTEHFFYGPGKTGPEDVEACLGRGPDAAVNCRADPDWEEYYTVLLPDDAKYQTALNREFCQRLYKLGDDPAAARRINFYCSFAAESYGLGFSQDALEKGFAVGTARFEPARELPYEVVLHRVSDLAPKSIDALTTRAIRLAARYGGRMIDWDCPIISRGKVFR